MRFAIIGTGFVADYYMKTLVNHAALELVGVFDANPDRMSQFADFHGADTYMSQAELLSDDQIELVLVLTNPETHFEIAFAALAAGKHVYCEKPLAMNIDDAHSLVEQAGKAGLILAGAPANAYSDAFNLTKETLGAKEIGKPKLAYVEMEDGDVFREKWQAWRSESGAAWPGKHEFEIGCTLEHAGYGLSWLIGLFGPIVSIAGSSATLFVDKGVEIAPESMAPDFSTAVLQFKNGAIARLTCGLCAPRDRSMTIMGEDGTLTIADLWDNRSDIYIERKDQPLSTGFKIARRLEVVWGTFVPFKPRAGRKVKYANGTSRPVLPKYPSQIDFMAGPEAVRLCDEGGGKSRQQLAAEALHVTEAALVLNRIGEHNGRYEMTFSF